MGGSSYISHFVCLYNFNYTGRPLRGPGIIGIILNKLRSKYEKTLGRVQRRRMVPIIGRQYQITGKSVM